MPIRDTPLPGTRLVVKVSQLIRLLTLHSGVTDFRLQCKVTSRISRMQISDLKGD